MDHFLDKANQPAFGLVEIHLCLPFGELEELSKKAAAKLSPGLSDDSQYILLASSYQLGDKSTSQTAAQSLPCCHPDLGLQSPHISNLLQLFCQEESSQPNVDLQHPYEGIAKIHLTDKTSENWPKFAEDRPLNEVENILVFGQ